jgi:DNA-directed RNA polymerase subunit RPC12/RpoP
MLEVRLLLLLLVAITIFLAIIVIRMFRPRARNAPDYKILNSFFLDHGEVSWLVRYKIKENDTEEIEIDTPPYCKNCKAKFEYTSSDVEELKSLKCPACGTIKRGYPLSTNYHSVQNFAQAKIKEFRKHLMREP